MLSRIILYSFANDICNYINQQVIVAFLHKMLNSLVELIKSDKQKYPRNFIVKEQAYGICEKFFLFCVP